MKSIKNGEKTYEGRLVEKIKDWQLDAKPIIIFHDNNMNNDEVKVLADHYLVFSNFKDAYEQLGNELIHYIIIYIKMKT